MTAPEADEEPTAPMDRPPLVVHVRLRDIRSGRVFEASASRVRVGRSAECEVQVPVGPSDGVSRVHCEFGLDGYGSVVLLDAGSTNGTRLNGRPVLEATRVAAEQAIALGDQGPALLIEHVGLRQGRPAAG